MYIIFTILGSLYLIYCVSFLGTLCYTIYKENEEEKRNTRINNRRNNRRINRRKSGNL